MFQVRNVRQSGNYGKTVVILKKISNGILACAIIASITIKAMVRIPVFTYSEFRPKNSSQVIR